MRVLYLIDSLLPGGAEASLAAMAPHLRDRGVAPVVAYLRPRLDLAPRFAAAGVELIRVPGGGRAGQARAFASLVRERRPDLVHTTLYDADQVGRVGGRWAATPVVSSLVNMAYGPEQRRDPRVSTTRLRAARAVDTLTARLVRRFHALTRTVAETMGHRLRIPSDHIEVIPRGRDRAELGHRSPSRAAAAREGLGLPPDAPLVLAAARHEYQKGLDVLLDAFAEVLRRRPDARLVVAGRTGNETEALEQRAALFNPVGAVQLLSHRDDIADLLCAADAFVLPSRWEGLGSVLLEAMALGAPIVASDLPAVREVVSGGLDALLVPAGQPSGFAEAIDATLAGGDAVGARAAAAERRFERDFEIGPVADAMVEFYRRALEAP